jgi:hypothetical protein
MDINNINDNFFAFLEEKSKVKSDNINKTEKSIIKKVATKKKKPKINKIVTIFNQDEDDDYSHLSSEYKKAPTNKHHIPLANNLCVFNYKEPEPIDSPNVHKSLNIEFPDALLPNITTHIRDMPQRKTPIRNAEQYEHKKKRVQTINGEYIFDSIKEAALHFGKHKSAICKAIANKTRCTGYYWQYSQPKIEEIIDDLLPTIPKVTTTNSKQLDLKPIDIPKDFLLIGKRSFNAILLLGYMYNHAIKENNQLRYNFVGYKEMTFITWINESFHFANKQTLDALKYLLTTKLLIEIEPLKYPYYSCAYYINMNEISKQILLIKKHSCKYNNRQQHLLKANNNNHFDNKLK